MPERDCSEHVEKVIVTLDKSRLEKKQHSNLIAALLRQIADYTDGWCSTEYAKDADLENSSGMTFYFKTDEKRTRFIDRIGFYSGKTSTLHLRRVRPNQLDVPPISHFGVVGSKILKSGEARRGANIMQASLMTGEA